MLADWFFASQWHRNALHAAHCKAVLPLENGIIFAIDSKPLSRGRW
jgi:hypothetical protein